MESRGFSSALVVDDHPLFCDALVMTLKVACNIENVTTAETLAGALRALEENGPPDVVVLDLHLPDVSGLDGLIRIKSSVADVPIVVVSSMADNRVIASTKRLGAAGYVPKHSHREVYRDAFHAIGQGGAYFPDLATPTEETATGTQDQKRDDALERLSTLTRQQSRILDLICEGKLNKQIAYDLSIAETTVKAHVTAIMRKLGVQSRTQAVLIAREASFANVLQPPSQLA